MTETSISVNRAIAALGWTVSLGLILAAWMVGAIGRQWDLSHLLALTAIPFIALGSIAVMRHYVVAMCRLLRATRTPSSEDPFVELHPVR